MSLTDIGRLRDNLVEISVGLSNADQIEKGLSPWSVVSAGRICDNRSWRLWFDQLFGPQQDPNQSLKIVKSTLQDLFTTCVLDQAYLQYQTLLIDKMNQIRSAVSHPKADKAMQRERYERFIRSAFGSTPNRSASAYVKTYMDAFDCHANKNPLTPSQTDSLRETMTDCSLATKPFWQQALKQSKLIEPIQSLVSKESSLIYNQSMYQAFVSAQCLIDLEGILEADLPIAVLAKWSQSEGLTAAEMKQVKEWIKKLNQNKHKINPSAFELMLNEIVQIINIEGHYPTTVEDLVLKLDEEGCEIFRQADPVHLRWFYGLKKGDEIVCNNKRLKLGIEIISQGHDNKNKDDYRVFELEGQENQGRVIKISYNQFRLKLDAARAKKDKWHWGVRAVDIVPNISLSHEEPAYGLDRHGMCVVLEKLSRSLDQIEWKSKTFTLDTEDRRHAMVIANHVYCMHEWQTMPEELHPKYLTFNEEGVLKASRLFRKMSWSYIDLEKFCRLIAGGNKYILHFLMHVSRLIDHAVAHFFREAVSYSLKTGKTNLISHKQPKNYKNPAYDTHVEHLCAQAVTLHHACFEKIKFELIHEGKCPIHEEDSPEEVNEEESDNTLKKEIGEMLQSLYEASPTPGYLDVEEMKMQVIHRFLHKNKDQELPDRIDTQTPNKSYYQSVFDWMMNYNRKALNK